MLVTLEKVEKSNWKKGMRAQGTTGRVERSAIKELVYKICIWSTIISSHLPVRNLLILH